MIDRLILTLILALMGYMAYRLYVRHQIRRATANQHTDPLLANGKPGVPTILYFTTPTCTFCHMNQIPMLERLQRDMGADHLRLVGVDATEDPDAARRWGVLSVPTLFVLGQDGQPRRVFNGAVGIEQLKQALQAS
jgi:thioredoxin-like negative regulator of GroEL